MKNETHVRLVRLCSNIFPSGPRFFWCWEFFHHQPVYGMYGRILDSLWPIKRVSGRIDRRTSQSFPPGISEEFFRIGLGSLNNW